MAARKSRSRARKPSTEKVGEDRFDPLKTIRVRGAHTLQAVLPVPLNFGYPFEASFSRDADFLAGLGVLAATALTLIRCPRSMTTLGLCLYVVYLLPVLQLTPGLANAGVYDRYLCVPVLGIAIALERAASFAAGRRPDLRRPLLAPEGETHPARPRRKIRRRLR